SDDIKKPATTVVDLGAAPADRETKSGVLLALLREMNVRRDDKGRLVILQDHRAVPLDSPDGVKVVQAEYGKRYSKSVTPMTGKDAIAAFASTDVPKIAPDVKVEEGAAATQADLLVELAKKHCEFFHDEQDIAYVSYREKGKRETLKLRSSRFRSWL